MSDTEAEPKQSCTFYQKPFLASDGVELAAAGSSIVLRDGARKLELTIDGDLESARSLIDSLRNPEADIWKEFKSGEQNGLADLLDKLDRFGWIREADKSGAAQFQSERNDFYALRDRAVSWLRSAPIGEEALRHFSRLANDISTHRISFPEKIPAGISLPHDTLELLLHSWKQTSPLALQLFASVLRDESTALDSLAITMSDRDDVSKQLWSGLVLLLLCGPSSPTGRYREFVPRDDLSGPGLNVLVQAEGAAESLLNAMGPSSLLTLLDKGKLAKSAAVLVYLHQYFITIRYIEAVISFLRYRLRNPLRDLGFRYLMEEYGHEIHELEACLDLGLREDEVREFAPLPYFLAYPEVLGFIAQIDPLAFCLSVTVAEGLPGTTKPIVRALAAKGVTSPNLAAHQEIDVKLDHTLFTRRFLQTIPWVESEVARRSIERFLFVLELSQLCWSQVVRYVEHARVELVPREFDLTPAEVLSLWSEAR